ncbi:unnamed protein product [Brassicogethes aeneus]|uniref:Uncharacterized protein n=1 Tax=Brassicogethes aeneus TaxID=1431903 RepID=A0A9P0B849_BRAAE|nr:unnamed protein product [Brassicogethes aeneus]
MKQFLLFTSVLFLLYQQGSCVSESDKKIMQEAHDACSEETQVDQATLSKAINDSIFINTQKMRCYAKCLFVHFKIIDGKTGKLTIDKFKKSYPSSLVEPHMKAFNACNIYNFNANMCEHAWQLVTKCLVSQPTYHFI